MRMLAEFFPEFAEKLDEMDGKINDVKNKVFVNSNVLIILFNDGTCSYSGLLYGTYNYNSKTNELTMNYKNNMGLEKNKIYTYDKKTVDI